MNIGWVVVNFYPDLAGGAEHYTWNMSQELIKRGHQIHVFTQKTKKSSAGTKTYHEKINVHRVNSYGIHYRLKYWPRLVREIKKYHLDKIIILDYAQLYTLQTFKFAKKHQLPCYLMINDIHSLKVGRHSAKQKPLVWYDKYFAKHIFKKASTLLVRTSWTKNYLIKRYLIGKEKIRVTPSGLTTKEFELGNKDFFEKKFGLKNNIILFFGRIRKQKGALEILKAFLDVKKEIPKAKLVYVGPDEKEYDGLEFTPELKKIIKKYHIRDVSFLGPLYGKAKNNALAAANVMCLPSTFENFGQGYSQALAQKTPVIGTNRGGIPEIINHGKDGFLIKIGDTKKLATYLVTLLKDQGKQETMGSCGRKKVQKYNYEILSKKLETIIDARK